MSSVTQGSMLLNVFTGHSEAGAHVVQGETEHAEFKSEALRGKGEWEIVMLSVSVCGEGTEKMKC